MKLNRDEMKKIMAGSEVQVGWCGSCLGSIGSWYGCKTSAECSQVGRDYCSSGASICSMCSWD